MVILCFFIDSQLIDLGLLFTKTCSSTSSPCLLYLLYHGSLRDGNIVKWEVESEQRSHALGLIALKVWKGVIYQSWCM